MKKVNEQVFISWSGDKSYSIALILNEYLKLMIQSLSPYLSSKDILKGRRWNYELSKTLSKVKFGILCLTKDNLNSDWILFEAGAISKSLEDSNVFTVLFDNLLPSDIIGPLSYFQHTIFNKKDFEKLIFDLYSLLEEKPLDLDSLKKTYNIFWPELESKINDVINQPESKNLAFEEPSDREYLKEILLLNRQILNNQDESLKGYINYISKYNDIELLSPDNNDMNHPIKVVIDPIEIDEEGIKKLVRIVVEKNKANIEKTDYPNDRRGVQISIIFDSEFEDNLWKIDFIFHKGNTYVSSSRIKVIEKEIDDNTIWRD